MEIISQSSVSLENVIQFYNSIDGTVVGCIDKICFIKVKFFIKRF